MPKVDWLSIEVGSAFHAIGEYAKRVEQQIDRLGDEERERIHAATATAEEEEVDILLQEHDWLFSEALPRNFRYSCVFLLLTTIETTLDQICKHVERRRKLPLPVTDLRGNAIERTRKYLGKLAGIAMSAHPFDAQLGHLLKIRHCVAHAAGKVDEMSNPSPAELHEAARQLQGFSVGPDGYIEIEKAVCARLVAEAAEWEMKIVKAVRGW